MIKRFSMVTLLFAMVALFISTPGAFAQSNAKVRVVHGSPDAPAVDVYVGGNRVLSNVPFFTVSDYLDLPAGSYDIKVTPAGDANTAVIDAKGVAVEGGKAYTIAAVGQLANIKAQIYVDNLAAPAAGKAHVRVLHLSPDAPAVDVKVAGGATLTPNLAFPNASAYLPVDAGTYNLQVTPAGQSAVVIDLPNTTLEAGKIYDVFATNVVASIKPEVKVTTPAAAPTAGAPSALPTTSGEDTSMLLFGAAAAALLAGGVALRRRVR